MASLQAVVSHQKRIIAAGCIVPLVAMLKGGSAAAQAYAAQALANAAAYNAQDGQNAIAAAGAVPVLLGLLSSGKAQITAAGALAKLAYQNAAIQAEITNASGITPLLALLDGIDVGAQVQAASALAELARGNVEVQAAIAKAGGIGPLLALLSSRSGAAQSKSMAALAQLAHENRENQEAIARMGGIKPLVGLLAGELADHEVQAHASFALMEITRSNKSNQQAVVRNGGIGQLAMLMKQSQDEAVKAEVAGALWSLSQDPEIKIAIAQASTIAPLVILLGLGDSRGSDHAARALASLGLDNSENQIQITQLLIELLGSGPEEAHARAVASLNSLVEENPNAHHTIAKAGNPAALVDLLKGTNPPAKDYALWSLSLSISSENQNTVEQAGGVQPLIDSIADERTLMREQAAAALAKLTLDNDDTRSAVTKAGAVSPLIKLLDPEAQSELVRQNAALGLSELSVDPMARDEIVAEGGIDPLVRSLSEQGIWTKTYASTALARMAKSHAETQSVICLAGAIKPLVGLLDGSESSEAQEEAAGALFALSDHEPSRKEITKCDGIGWLVLLLGCNNSKAREHAEGALVRLSIENANRVLIINKLVVMLQDTVVAAQEQAAAALANLARESEDNRKSIVEANGIPPLLSLLDSTSARAKENAVGAITQLCRKSRENQLSIAKDGGIPKLVGVLLGFSASSMKDMVMTQLCTLAASAIQEMAKGNRRNQEAISEAGAIAPLVVMLGSPSPPMQANAAGALANLARGHPENQMAIARTGAIAPLCTLVREGSPETKDTSAAAIWSLSTDNAPNKDTIAKLGGIDPLVGLLVSGTTEKSQMCVAGALTALASKHLDNRQLVVKRLVGLLGSSAAKKIEIAGRVLVTISHFMGDSSANQVMVAKAGGIPPLLTWVQHASQAAKTHACAAMLALVADNATAQTLVARSAGIPPLIDAIRTSRSTPAAQEYAARALWHLASQPENQQLITDNNGIKPLVAMLSADGDTAPELAAVIMVRLTRANPDVSIIIAEKGGVIPLVKLMSGGSPGAQQQAAAALAELAIVCRNRDPISNAGGIEQLIRLMSSSTVGTPASAARALAHLARDDDEEERQRQANAKKWADPNADEPHEVGIRGSDERRSKIHMEGGVKRLIAMLDGTIAVGTVLVGLGLEKKKPKVAADAADGSATSANEIGSNPMTRMQEQAAIALADIALNSYPMQDAIIEENGVPPLLNFMRLGTSQGQEYAARALWHLCQLDEGSDAIENQGEIVKCGAIPVLVQLLKTGKPKAQEYAAAGISDLARGGIVERRLKAAEDEKMGRKRRRNSIFDIKVEAPESKGGGEGSKSSSPAGARQKSNEELADDDDPTDRLFMISDTGGILPLVALLGPNATVQARENATGALWHLAIDVANQVSIARLNGISPIVTILDDGTPTAHGYAAAALFRLAVKNSDNQAQIAKHLVALLGNVSAGAQQRAAHALKDLGGNNPGSPVLIVNAGAISPLVTLLSTGAPEVKEETAGALSTLAFNSPSTQLAIATGLVALIGAGTADSQEHVTQLLLTLARDPDNRTAIATAGAIPRLVIQLKGGAGLTSNKAKELAACVLAHLSNDSEDNVEAIASASGIRPLISLLSAESLEAQAQAASVLADMSRNSKRSKATIISEGGIALYVGIISRQNSKQGLSAAAEAAGALQSLTAGEPETQKVVTEAGAIKPLVALLSEEHDTARKKAAGAIASLSEGSQENQDAVESFSGVSKLVTLIAPGVNDEVRAEAASALAVLTRNNKTNQDKITAAGGIAPLVAMLQEDEIIERAKEKAALAVWSLATKHYENQMAVATAGGIDALVIVLGVGTARAQENAASALSALALDNSQNELVIAKLIVELLGSADKKASAKAARAISSLARSNPSNQKSIAMAGGIELLVKLLNPEDGGVGGAGLLGGAAKEALELARVQKELASAIWSLTLNNPANRIAIADAGGIPPLILLLDGHSDVHRYVAGALWSLADKQQTNQMSIAQSGGIAPLVTLLKNGSKSTREKETAAGALHALAEAFENRVAIADAGGIAPLVALFDGGSPEAIEQASGALLTLVTQNVPNQTAIANEAVSMLKNGSVTAQEHATELIRNLALDAGNRGAIAKAGAIPELTMQLEAGSLKAMGLAANGLALIALKSAEHRATVTQELVKLLGSNDEAVRQRASEALRDMAADEKGGKGNQKKRQTSTKIGGGAVQSAGLVNLLKDGLKDGRVEAQEYAVWSLSQSSDLASREAIVANGGIQPLIASLQGGKLSAVAQDHASMVLSGLAPLGNNAITIRDEDGIEPLVLLLSQGNTDAKVNSAAALAQLALRADAALEIAKAGAVSAFVRWLDDPTLGPPDVAASALSDIALDNFDTQSQIAEEGAIAPLVGMLSAAMEAREASLQRQVNSRVAAVVVVGQQPGGEVPASTGAAEVEIRSPTALRRAGVTQGMQVAALAPLEDGKVSRSSSPERSSAQTMVMEVKARKLSNMAAGAIATLCKGNVINQVTVTEEGGIPPLVELLDSRFPLAHENATNALWHLAANEDNQSAIARAGGIPLLVQLLHSEATIVQQYTTAAIESLSRDHTENQIALAKMGAIEPLVDLLGCDNVETQEHAVGALLNLASHDEESRNAVVKKLVAVLDIRNAAAQMKAAEALAVLAARSSENRKAITAAQAIPPLVKLLGDGRRARSGTPQERAAAVLADLARSGENKITIVTSGGVGPLVAMLSSESPEAATHAAGGLWHLAALGSNKKTIADASAIAPLVTLLKQGTLDAQRYAAGALWHLTSSADNKVAMIDAGAIVPLIKCLSSKNAEAREYAAAVVSALARSGGKDPANKRSVVAAGGIAPLIKCLSEKSTSTQKHAACALWGLASDGQKESVYNRQIVAAGAIPPLLAVLLKDNQETRGFAAACLSCLCKDAQAHTAIYEAGGPEPLLALAHGSRTWLQNQAREMLAMLNIPIGDPEDFDAIGPLPTVGPFGGAHGGTGAGAPGQSHRSQAASHRSAATSATARTSASQGQGQHTWRAKHQFHFFSFQIQPVPASSRYEGRPSSNRMGEYPYSSR